MSDKETTQVYHSAVDLWIIVLLLIGPLAMVVLTFYMLQQGRNQDALIFLIAGAGTLLVTAAFTVPCRYTLLGDSMTIRCGLLFMRVPYDKIKSVEKSGSWLSGPALSLRRVKITTVTNFYLVSPAERDEFIAQLNDRIDA